MDIGGHNEVGHSPTNQVNRTANMLVIQRSLTLRPEFGFCPAENVASVSTETGLTRFDAPGATYRTKMRMVFARLRALVL